MFEMVEVSSGERVRVYGSRTHGGIKFHASMKFLFFSLPSLPEQTTSAEKEKTR